jgi:hypothetical protein
MNSGLCQILKICAELITTSVAQSIDGDTQRALQVSFDYFMSLHHVGVSHPQMLGVAKAEEESPFTCSLSNKYPMQ